jgi:hypothetical protein
MLVAMEGVDNIVTVVAIPPAGESIPAGVVYVYLQSLSGPTADLWWNDSTKKWQAEMALAGTGKWIDDLYGGWNVRISLGAWNAGTRYNVLVKGGPGVVLPEGTLIYSLMSGGWSYSLSTAPTSDGTQLGTGRRVVTIHTLTTAGVPVPFSEVWVSTDDIGAELAAGVILSDGKGLATINLDPGDYYVWRRSPRCTFSNPQQVTVT